MNPIKQLGPEMSVTGGVVPADIATIAGLGFRTLINNRPDGEAADQAPNAHLEAAARQAGLEYRYIPISPGGLTEDNVTAFAEAMQTMPAPILAFCRSGPRSINAWTAASKRLGTDAEQPVRTGWFRRLAGLR